MFLVIDGNSIGLASQSTRPLKSNGIETQGIFHSIKTIKSLRNKFPEYSNVIVLWDGKAKFRYDLYPEYKANRKKNAKMVELKDKFNEARPVLQSALNYLGISQIEAPNFEADDLAGYLTRKAGKKGSKCMLITGDQDWQQLVNSITSWHDPRKSPGKFCDKASFREVTGCDSGLQFLQKKSLQGDSSDHISGVGGIGDKASQAIIDNYGGVKGLVKTHKEQGEFTKENIPEDLRQFKKKVNDFCSGGLDIFARNYKLMDLLTDKHDSYIKEDMKVTKGNLDFDSFKQLCHEYSFLSIIREFQNWKECFNTNAGK